MAQGPSDHLGSVDGPVVHGLDGGQALQVVIQVLVPYLDQHDRALALRVQIGQKGQQAVAATLGKIAPPRRSPRRAGSPPHGRQRPRRPWRDPPTRAGRPAAGPWRPASPESRPPAAGTRVPESAGWSPDRSRPRRAPSLTRGGGVGEARRRRRRAGARDVRAAINLKAREGPRYPGFRNRHPRDIPGVGRSILASCQRSARTVRKAGRNGRVPADVADCARSHPSAPLNRSKLSRSKPGFDPRAASANQAAPSGDQTGLGSIPRTEVCGRSRSGTFPRCSRRDATGSQSHARSYRARRPR